jgi:flagellar protein FliO/FliZ
MSPALSAEVDVDYPTIFRRAAWGSTELPGNVTGVPSSAVKDDRQFVTQAGFDAAVTAQERQQQPADVPANDPATPHPQSITAAKSELQVASPPTPESAAQGSQGNESLQYAPPSAPQPVSMSDLVGRLVFTTLLVLAACVASLFAAKRWLVKGPAANGGNGKLRVLDVLSLNQRCSVQLVDADGEKLLVGLDPTGLKVLLKMNGTFEDALHQSQQSVTPHAPDTTPYDNSRDTLGELRSWAETHQKL